MQYGLFEPEFFALAAAKCGMAHTDDAQLAAALVYCGLQVLQEEALANAKSGNFPLHAGAILLSFPQTYQLPEKTTDDRYDWRALDGSHELSSYWRRQFPGLEQDVVSKMGACRLLQRSAGSPQTYTSLTSCLHAVQFRRIAALSLITQEGAAHFITGKLPHFDIRWGDGLRTTTEVPLFTALIAQFYAAVYEKLGPELLTDSTLKSSDLADLIKKAGRSALPGRAGALKKDLPATLNSPIKPSTYALANPWQTAARWVALLALAWLPTFLNALAHELSFLQLLFGSFSTNTGGAIFTAALIGYTRRTLSENGEDYHIARRALSLVGGALIVIMAVLWSVQENVKWLKINTYLSSLTNTLFLAVIMYFSIMNLAILISYGVRLISGRIDTSKCVPLRYPTLVATGLLLFCAADILPEVFVRGTQLNYSPTAAMLIAYGAMFVPLCLFFSVLLGNQMLLGRFRMPQGWPVFILHFFAGIAIFLANQFTPYEEPNMLVLGLGALGVICLFLPTLLLTRRKE